MKKILLPLIAMALIVGMVSPSVAVLSDYGNCTQFNVSTVASVGTVTNYQILVNLSNMSGVSDSTALYTNGTTLPNWTDITFTTEGDVAVPFWPRNHTETANNISVYVKVPSAGTTGTNYRFQFGNASKVSSLANIYNTADLGDDFLGSAYNSTQWVPAGTPGTITVANGYVNVTGGSTAWYKLFSNETSGFSFGYNKSIVMRWAVDSEANRWNIGLSDTIGSNNTLVSTQLTGDKNYTTFKNNVGTQLPRTINHASSYAISEIFRNGSASVIFYDPDTVVGTSTANIPTKSLPATIATYSTSRTVSVDWVFVRSRVYIEPTYSDVVHIAGDEAPVAAFSGSPLEGIPSFNVTFTDASTYAPTAWNWSFGDGTYSEEQNPEHTYTTNGYFTVILNASNAYGYDNETKTFYITSGSTSGAKTYSFPLSAAGGENQTLITQLPNQDYLILWANKSYGSWHNIYSQTSSDFGQTWSTPKLFASNASYDVQRFYPFRFNVSRTCAVYNIIDASTETIGDAFYRCTDDNAGTWTPAVQWNYGSLGAWHSYQFFVTAPPMRLSSQRILIPVQWWNTTSSNNNMRVYYSDDNLTTISLLGSIIPSTSATIPNEGNIVQFPNKTLYMSMRNYTNGLYGLYSLSTDNGSTWSTPARSYIVSDDSQIVIGTTQWDNIVLIWNNLSSTTQVRHPITFGMSLDNLISHYQWSDINTTATKLCYPNLAFNRTGTALITYWDQTNGGWYFVQIDPTLFMVRNITPIANFVSDVDYNVSAGHGVIFNDTSQFSPTSWNWSFGDGEYSEDQNPVHSYSSPGAYDVSLTSTNAYGDSTITKQYYLLVDPSDMTLNASFSQSPNPSQIDQPVTFSDTSTGVPDTWNWTFGDGNTSELQNPSHAFPALGSYTVYLNVTNATGSWSNTSATHTVVNASGYTPRDVWMEGQYNITVHVTSSSDGTPLAATYITSNGISGTASTLGYAFVTEGFGVYTITVSLTNYATKTVSFVVDEDDTIEIQLTPSTTQSQNTNIIYTPHQVRVYTVDAYGVPLIGTNITINYIASTLPSTDTNWLINAYGIDAAVAADMVNSSIAMTGISGDDGSNTFTLFGSLTYGITLTNATIGANCYKKLAPIDASYRIYCPVTGQTAVNNTLTAVNTSKLVFYKLNTSSYYNLSMIYEDQTGYTTNLSFNVYDYSAGRTLVYTKNWTGIGTAQVVDNYTVYIPLGKEYQWQYNATKV